MNSPSDRPLSAEKLTRRVVEGMRLRHAEVEKASDKLAVARDMAYLSHLDRAELLAEVERLRGALETLWPGLVLDLRYADDDDDKDAMRARIQTVEEALSDDPK